MKFFIGTFTLLAALNAFSMGEKAYKEELCNVDLKIKTKRIIPKHKPNYFFKTSPDGRYVFYISEFKNYRLDTKTGKEIVLPGNVDPIPSPDGKILSSVNFRKTEKKSFSLNLTTLKDWDVQRLKNGEVDYSKVVTDEENQITYQSIGQLGENQYRVLSASAASDYKYYLQFKDYALSDGKITSKEKDITLIPFTGLRIPMISKSGEELIALDTKSNQSVIYKIDSVNKSVKEVERLAFPTGKGDFSSDSKKITFHMTEQLKQSGYVKIIPETNMPSDFDDDKEVRNIFVYDRETKTVIPVTQNKKGNSYFPVFLNDGRVVYLDQGEDQKLSFVISEIPKIAPRSIERARDCYTGKFFDEAFRKLSEHWVATCQEWKSDSSASKEIMTLNISSELCNKIALGSGDKDLVKVCKALKESELSRPKVIKKSRSVVQKIFQVKCAICHQADIPFKDPVKLKAHKDSILKRIHTKDTQFAMPQGAPLSDSEKQEVTDYLESL